MAKKKMRRKDDCNPTDCGMQKKLEDIGEKWSGIAKQLTENHQALRENVVELTANIKGMGKLEKRTDRLEEEVKNNSRLVYKIVGIGMAVAALMPALLKYVNITIG